MRSRRGHKSGRNRRAERSRAFQVLYGLSFSSVRSLPELGRRFASAPYAETPEGAEEAREVFILRQEDGSGEEPDLLRAEDGDAAQVVIPEAGEGPSGFAWDLVRGAWLNREKLDRLIADFSQNWRLERMGRVELALLRLALQELVFMADTPPRVILNEALELSRQFGDEVSRAFVNGILDAAAKAVESGALPRAGGIFKHGMPGSIPEGRAI